MHSRAKTARRALTTGGGGRISGLAITVIYQGNKDHPLLSAGGGRYPSLSTGAPAANSGALGLFFSGNTPFLNLNIRQGEQDRVLAEVRQRLENLAQSIDSLTPPAGDRPAEAVTALSSEPRALSASADQ
jgi:hypothetical protein